MTRSLSFNSIDKCSFQAMSGHAFILKVKQKSFNKKKLKSVGMTLAKVKEQDGMMLAKVKNKMG